MVVNKIVIKLTRYCFLRGRVKTARSICKIDCDQRHQNEKNVSEALC